MCAGCFQDKPGSVDLSDQFAFIWIETLVHGDLSCERDLTLVRVIQGMLGLIMALSVFQIGEKKQAW